MSSRLQTLEHDQWEQKGNQSVLGDDAASLVTVTAESSNVGDPTALASGIRTFDFTDDLQNSWVYKRNHTFRESRFSLSTRSTLTCHWSYLSALTMSDVSAISIINLPITEAEVFNVHRSSQTWSKECTDPVSHSQSLGNSQRFSGATSDANDDTNPLSVFGSVLAVFGIVNLTVGYISSFERAPKYAVRLREELQCFLDIFKNLMKVIAGNSGEALTGFPDLRELTNGLLHDLKFLKEKLGSKLFSKRSGQSLHTSKSSALKWPLREEKTKELVDRFSKYHQHIHVALSKKGLALIEKNVALTERGVALISDMREDIDNKDRLDIVQKISTLDFVSKQKDAWGKRHDKTGHYLHESSEFQQWFSRTKPSTLWCPGVPGAGKTVMTAILVDYAIENTQKGRDAVIYIYVDHKDPATHQVPDLLANLTRQLAEKTAEKATIQELKDRQSIGRHRHRNSTEAQQLSLLRRLIQDFEKVYAFFDALDELPQSDQDALLRNLKQLEHDMFICMTSRPNIEISTFDQLIRKDIVTPAIDVQKYMEEEMKTPHLATLIAGDPFLQSAILESVDVMKGGTFRLTRLQIEMLNEQTSAHNARKKLQSSLHTLGSAYDGSLERIMSQGKEDQELAKAALSIICCAKRPLGVNEARHALAIEPREESILDTALGGKALPKLETLLRASAGLITQQEAKDNRGKDIVQLRLVHYALQEYLERHTEWLSASVQYDMSRRCIMCLYKKEATREATKKIHTTGKKKPRRLWRPPMEVADRWLDDKDFSQYAAKYWYYHIQKILALSIVNTSTLLSSPPSNQLPLHYAVERGLLELIDLLFKLGANVNTEDKLQMTPLHYAAAKGSLKLVNLLLKHGANVDAEDTFQKTPLHYAAENGPFEVTDLLLERRANVNAEDAFQMTPLHYAAKDRSLEVLDLLLKHEANVNTRNAWQMTALHMATQKGQYDVVTLLIKQGADVNAKDYISRGPLSYAHYSREFEHRRITSLLLNKGARIENENPFTRRSIWRSLENGEYNSPQQDENAEQSTEIIDTAVRRRLSEASKSSTVS